MYVYVLTALQNTYFVYSNSTNKYKNVLKELLLIDNLEISIAVVCVKCRQIPFDSPAVAVRCDLRAIVNVLSGIKSPGSIVKMVAANYSTRFKLIGNSTLQSLGEKSVSLRSADLFPLYARLKTQIYLKTLKKNCFLLHIFTSTYEIICSYANSVLYS